MIELTQTLNEEDYRKAAAIHYRTYRISRFRPWLSLVLFCVGARYIAYDDQQLFGFLCVGISLVRFFRRKQFEDHIARSAATAGGFGEEIRIELAEGIFRSEQDGMKSEYPLSKLHRYVRRPIGILVYPQRNLFCFIKAEAFESAQQLDELQKMLDEAGVEELKVY